jgi:predicted RNA-binding Zn-ribbon protein involved in translation (DUF1610 family)
VLPYTRLLPLYRFLQNQIDSALGSPFDGNATEVQYACPRCGNTSKKKHLSINYEKGVFQCWKCNFGGSVLYLAKYLGMEVRRPAADWSKSIRHVFSSHKKPILDDVYDNELELEYPCDVKPIHPASRAMSYLAARGVNWHTANHYKMVESVGDSKWSNRIFIPSLANGVPVYWVARSMNPNATSKYLTPVDIDKKFYLFNFQEVKKYSYVVITEGVFDAIAAGINATALFGKHASESQIQQLVSANFDNYLICLDSDARKDAEQLANRLDAHKKSVYMVSLPQGKDPATDPQIKERIAAATPFNFSSWAAERIEKLT